MDPPANMDIDESTELDLVSDDFEEGKHERLDNDIAAIFQNVTPAATHSILSMIVLQLRGRGLKKYENMIETERLLDNHPRIKDLILEGSEVGYRKLRLLKLLRQEPVSLASRGHPPVSGWEHAYVGDAARALWDHIVKWFIAQTGPEGRPLYAKYCAIVQSSGMGKSRVIDELSKHQFVIPVNLGDPKTSGYPPSDIPARHYLSSSGSQEEAFNRSCTFLHALFLETTGVVGPMTKETVTEQFRNNMKDRMKHDCHGEWRVSFYEAVVQKAKSLRDTYSAYFGSSGTEDRSDFPLREAFAGLCKVHADQGRTMLRKPHTIPHVVLAFDEVQCLTEPMYEADHKWSRFGELRRAIRGLSEEPLFTVFLSTSGAMFSVTPTPTRDISSKMVAIYEVIPPFFNLGFDQLAIPIDFSQAVTLSKIAAVEHFASYGRPLWRPFLKDQPARLINFAIMKLLGGPQYTGNLTPTQKLACLAERIPIEFLSTNFASQISEQEKLQVHAHMRVVLKIDDSLETIVTTSPSEPTLSEAAYSLMMMPGFNPPQALQEILNGFVVHKGKLGELIVTLLFTMARDKAVGPPTDSGLPLRGQRWCTVPELLESLFCTSTHITAFSCSQFTPNGSSRSQVNLSKALKGSSVYFTHFIKVHQHAVIRLEFLMHLMVRGTAILCANNQPGIDGIIPFLLEGEEIKEDNIGVIMFQVKNDEDYQDKPDRALVLAMDPHRVRLANPDIPIIRFFFALAASNPTLQHITHEASYKSQSPYKAYDFWVSGLSPMIFNPVVGNEVAWGSLLKVSRHWEQIYSLASQRDRKLRKSMNPGAGMAEEFWQNWCKNVPHS